MKTWPFGYKKDVAKVRNNMQTLADIEAEALYRYPILKTDCRLERLRKEGLRKAFVERLKRENGLIPQRKEVNS